MNIKYIFDYYILEQHWYRWEESIIPLETWNIIFNEARADLGST